MPQYWFNSTSTVTRTGYIFPQAKIIYVWHEAATSEGEADYLAGYKSPRFQHAGDLVNIWLYPHNQITKGSPFQWIFILKGWQWGESHTSYQFTRENLSLKLLYSCLPIPRHLLAAKTIFMGLSLKAISICSAIHANFLRRQVEQETGNHFFFSYRYACTPLNSNKPLYNHWHIKHFYTIMN